MQFINEQIHIGKKSFVYFSHMADDVVYFKQKGLNLICEHYNKFFEFNIKEADDECDYNTISCEQYNAFKLFLQDISNQYNVLKKHKKENYRIINSKFDINDNTYVHILYSYDNRFYFKQNNIDISFCFDKFNIIYNDNTSEDEQTHSIELKLYDVFVETLLDIIQKNTTK